MSDNLFSVESPICPICRKAVPLELAKTDEDGVAIHEACYLGSLCLIAPLRDRPRPSRRSAEAGAPKQRLGH